ncbi:RHS repeat-associated core domain-containing protein [Pseudomonas fluorescens]|uniref:RHS repeat-associated core domain-containing protein n=1 Tax=Pseudomonas fluorescens TaxID=294 RepID=UPI0009BF3742|nr:RHS repeat-associated core domain-containing protein [Pseudomonas fluorescens]
MHSRTPTLTVFDSRRLTVRSTAYHRTAAADPLEKRVTYQVNNCAGRSIKQYDPRLFKLMELEPDISPNIQNVYSLSGQALLINSVDAGIRLYLSGVAGQQCHRWDSNFTHVKVEYDNQLRPVKESVKQIDEGPRNSIFYSYGGSDEAFVRFNQGGRIIRVDDGAGTVFSRSYSLQGDRLESTRHFLDSIEQPHWPALESERDQLHEKGEGSTTLSLYNAVSQLVCEIDARKHVRLFEYTVGGQLAGIRLIMQPDGPVKKVVGDVLYNAANKVVQQTLANGVVCSAVYCPIDGRLEELKSYRPERCTLQHLIYRYDRVGNIISIEDRALPVRYFRNQKIEPVRTFCYDTLYQLICATGWQVIGGGVGSCFPDFQSPADPSQLENYTEVFSYDSGGNLVKLLRCAALGSRTQRMGVSKYSNRSLSEKIDGELPTEEEIALAHDLNGNKRLLFPGQTLGWDERNQLKKFQRTSHLGSANDSEIYVYDDRGQRRRKIGSVATGQLRNRSETRYLDTLEIRSGLDEEIDVVSAAAGLCDIRMVQRVDQRNGQDIIYCRYSLIDLVGSNCIELDDDGAIISEEVFYSYGCTAWWAGSDRVKANSKTMRYSGKELDSTGLYYYGFRYYMPWWCQWLSPDPDGVADGLNLYRMVANNPVTFFDDQGLQLVSVNEDSQDYAKLVATFEPGDILFGLREPRDFALKALNRAGFKEFSWEVSWNRNLGKFSVEKKRNVLKQNDLTDAAFGPTVTAGVYNANDQIKAELIDFHRGIAYKKFAMTNRYFQKDEKGVGNFFQINVPMWRRSSKAGLEFQIFQRNKQVLFAIDGLMETLDDIVSKKPDAGTSVTASEIRYLYRRRGTPEVQKNARFFLANREVPQSEFFNLPAWQRYHPKKTYRTVSVPRRVILSH